MHENVKCPNCNATIDNGAKFCSECGTMVEQQVSDVDNQEVISEVSAYAATFCPECGSKTTTEFKFCQECGARLRQEVEKVVSVVATVEMDQGSTADPATEKPKKKIPVIFLAASFLGVVILATLGVFIFLKMRSGEKPYVLYGKDNELCMSYVNKIEPFEVTDGLMDDVEDEDSIDYDGFEYMGTYVFVSDDQRYMFYPDQIDSDSDVDGTVSYYWKDLKDKNSEGSTVKVDNDISNFDYLVLTSDGNKFFYTKGEDDKLYVYDRKSDEKYKIDSNVQSFYVNTEANYVIYTTGDGEDTTLYESTLSDDEWKNAKIDTISRLNLVEADSKNVYYFKDENFYVKKNGKDKEKILSDVNEVVSVVDSDAIYYIKSKEVTQKLSELIDDDMLADDSKITEPALPTYPNEPIYPDSYDYTTEEWVSDWYGSDYDYDLEEWGYWNETTDWDAYYAAENQYDIDYEEWEDKCNELDEEYNTANSLYEEKVSRDNLREELDNDENTVTYDNYDLCYWDGKSETVIAKKVEYDLDTPTASDSGKSVAYRKYSTSSVDKQKLSTLLKDYDSDFNTEDVVNDLSENVTSSRIVSEDIYVATGKKENKLECNEADDWEYSTNGNLYYLDDYDSEDGYGTLMEVSVSEDTIGKPKKIDDDVNGYILGNLTDNIYYYKDQDDRSCDLYLAGDRISSDVNIESLYNYEGSNTLLYYIDYSYDDYSGTLCQYKNGDQIKIADDVHSYVPIDETNVALLVDYDIEDLQGEMMLYSGKKKLDSVDSDVLSLVWDKKMLWYFSLINSWLTDPLLNDMN